MRYNLQLSCNFVVKNPTKCGNASFRTNPVSRAVSARHIKEATESCLWRIQRYANRCHVALYD